MPPVLPPPEFAETGLCVTRTGDAPPRRFQVLGERSSGTNLVKRLLGRNSDMTPCEDLGWKHGFVQCLAVPADLAVICVLRHAEAWALSMYAKPWHTTPAMQRLPFAEFIRAPWDTVIDRPRYFGGRDAVAGTEGQPLQQDRDPVTGARFANLFALRRAKLAHLLSWQSRGATCVLIRAEIVQDDPRRATEALLRGLGHAPRPAFRPVQKRLGSKFAAAVEARPPAPAGMSEADRGFLREQVDASVEAALGYRY